MAVKNFTKGEWELGFSNVKKQEWNFGYKSEPTSYKVHAVATGGDEPAVDTDDFDETIVIGPNSGVPGEPYPRTVPEVNEPNLHGEFSDIAAHDLWFMPVHADGKITYTEAV